MKLSGLLLSFILIFSSAFAGIEQDPESFYLRPDHNITLTAIRATAVYGTRSLMPLLKTFPQDTQVRLIAYHPNALLIRDIKSGYEGWVLPDDWTEIDPKLISQIEAEAKEELSFKDAIKNEEVLPGMSFEHVMAALGKPTTKSFRSDEKGRFDIWTYTEFQRVTQYRQIVNPTTGRLESVPYTVKVPVGSMNVEFKSGRVSATERTQNQSLR